MKTIDTVGSSSIRRQFHNTSIILYLFYHRIVVHSLYNITFCTGHEMLFVHHMMLIFCLTSTDTHTVEELNERLQMSSSVVRRCASYWQTRGLLREETTDRYKLNQEEEAISYGGREQMDEEEEESAIASAEQQKEEQLQVR